MWNTRAATLGFEKTLFILYYLVTFELAIISILYLLGWTVTETEEPQEIASGQSLTGNSEEFASTKIYKNIVQITNM